MRAPRDRREGPADRRRRHLKSLALSCTACLPVTLQVTDPVFQFRPVQASPGLRLAFAGVLSVLAHAALIAVSALPRQAPQATPVQGQGRSLGARLVAPPAPAPRRSAPQLPPSAPVAALESKPAPPAAAPESGEAVAPLPAETLPARYRPASMLSRGPELLTPPTEGAWPSLPDTPPGRFQLELAIGADGRVERVVPLCEAPLCPAAGVYAELVSQWRFQPGDLAGEATPSRLRLEFEVGLPPEPGAPDDQAPRQ